jgi:iron complex outermembrane receptor protein/vitamin B12 transporter
MSRFTRLLICAFTFSFAVLTWASAPDSIRGTVFDPSGAVVPNATVELVDGQTQIKTITTDAKGQYVFLQKIHPQSQLRVSAPGFRTTEKLIALKDGAADLTVDIVLTLASFSEQVTVVSTGTPTPQAQLGAAVTVLSASDYAGTRDIQEGLRSVPGLQATQTGQAGGTTSLYIRGGGKDSQKVLLDGIPVNDIGGNVEFANVASAAIAQVEVLRGPNSVLYGSDALAGVVSLTTARGTTPLPIFTYLAEGGNFGTYRQEGSMGGRKRQFDYFADYARFDTRNSIPDSTFHNGSFAGNAGWTLSPTSTLRATIHHDQIASGQPNGIQLYGIATNAKQSNEDAYFGVTWENQTTPKWNNLIQYSGVRLRSNYTEFAPTGIPQNDIDGNLLDYLGDPVTLKGANGYSVSGQAFYQYAGTGPNAMTTYPNSDPASTDTDSVYAQSNYRFNPHAVGLVAFRYADERGYSDGTTNSVTRGNYSYTFELQGDLRGRLFYVLGGGLEDNGLFGFAATPRASLAWRATNSTKLRASFGKGIKEPAIFDQLDSLYALLKSPSSQPEGDQLIAQDHFSPVGPEKSRSYDGGADQYFFGERSRVSLSLFHNEFTGGIEYIPPQALALLGVPAAVVTLAATTNYGATVNTKDYRAQGVELETETQVTRDVFVRAGYTYVDAVIQRSFTGDAVGPSYNPLFPSVAIGVYSPLIGARPFRLAPHTGYLQAGYRHSKFFAALSETLVSRRDDSDFLSDSNYGNSLLLPNRNLDAAYQKLDLTASYQAKRNLSVESSFQNILCEHYSEAFGFPSLPFTFRTGMKFSFGGESWSVK